MNLDQTMALLRWALSIGGPLGAWLVSHGLTSDQVNAFSSGLLALIAAVPPIVSLIWSLTRHSDAGKLKEAKTLPDGVKLKAAAALPEVDLIQVKPAAPDTAAAALAADASEPKIQRLADLPAGHRV